MDELLQQKKKTTNGLKPKLFHTFSSLDANFLFPRRLEAHSNVNVVRFHCQNKTHTHTKIEKKWPKIQLSSTISFTMQHVWQLQHTHPHHSFDTNKYRHTQLLGRWLSCSIACQPSINEKNHFFVGLFSASFLWLVLTMATTAQNFVHAFRGNLKKKLNEIHQQLIAKLFSG